MFLNQNIVRLYKFYKFERIIKLKKSMKKIKYLLLLTICNIYGQISFEDGKEIISSSDYSSKVTALISADLNNDGFKEVIVGSYYDNKILFYKNINGNLLHYKSHVLIETKHTQYASDFDLYSMDLDNDGLLDIIVTNDYLDKLSWYKNLGDFNFSTEIVITNGIDKPKSVIAGDIDNDGDNDIVVGVYNDKNVSIFINNGNGIFSAQKIITKFSLEVNKVKLIDLDKNGFLDIVCGVRGGTIYLIKNIDGTNFKTPEHIVGGSDTEANFGFLDINNDSYFDLIFISNYNNSINYVKNEKHNGFAPPSVIKTIYEPTDLVIKDIDNDGLKDIVVSTQKDDKVVWYKNLSQYYALFSFPNKVSTEVKNPFNILVEDFDNDNTFEFISSSHMNNDNKNKKLSIFKYNTTTSSYDESLINHFIGGPNVVRIADLNNDGLNDVIIGIQSIIWNENLGNNIFSLHKFISPGIKTSTVSDLEIKDIDSDGWLDIIGVVDGKLQVYKNLNGKKFELIYSLTNGSLISEIEISDINNDQKQDIIVSFNSSDTPIAKIINTGNFTFENLSAIYNSTNGSGYKAYKFKCGDLDGDGDIDIIFSAKDLNSILWLENDGSGDFSNKIFNSNVYSDNVEIGDIDNDGDLDVVSGYRKNAPDLHWHKNIENKSFETIKIGVQNIESITLKDINNDGFLDIIGTALENYSSFDERIFYYLFNGNSFEKQYTIESLGSKQSLNRDLAIGDLNNDGKLDIVSSYNFFLDKVKYFINSSTLSIEEEQLNKNITLYPNPSNEFISISGLKAKENYTIFNILGAKIDSGSILNKENINIKNLTSGTYFLQIGKRKALTFIKK